MSDRETLGCVIGCICLALLGACILIPVGCALNWFGEAAAVVRGEMAPHELLRKYSWFKDAAAQLDKKQADIKVYDNRLVELEKAYAGKSRADWARDDREQHSIWVAELSGVKASYNSLCAEYNAAMSKENWRFCEVGRLPQGATVPLPREFKPYETK